jgi:hypothetical protein
MISFRLSAEEYDRLQSLCSSHGACSVSVLARAAVNRLAAGNLADPLADEVSELRRQVQSLSHELDRISGAVNARSAKAQEAP